jgi:hypothetical protein
MRGWLSVLARGILTMALALLSENSDKASEITV